MVPLLYQGDLLVYAACYDWSMGKEKFSQSIGVNIFIHQNTLDEIQPKKKK